MKANNTVVIGFMVLVIAAIFGLQAMFSSFLPRFQWHEQFYPESDQPYGHHILYELLSEDSTVTPINKPLSKFFSRNTESGTYMFVSSEIFLWDENVDSLLTWVALGNDAFFSSSESPWFIDSLSGFNLDSAIFYEWHDTAEVCLDKSIDSSQKKYQYIHKDAFDTLSREWAFISDSAYVYHIQERFPIQSLGQFYYGHNFFEIKHGKGRVLVHLEPYLFTNYHILRDEGFEYSSHVIGYLNNNGNIFWDEYSTEYHYENDSENGDYLENSPLKVIFSQPALKHAWWVLLAGVALYILFKSKRQQRIIPVIYYPENTSKAYARALGALYHRSGEPKYLASEMMLMFHNFNRRKYQIQFDPNNKDFAAQLAKKSKVKIEIITDILNISRRLEYSDLAKMVELVQLYEILNIYYKSSK